MGRLSNRSYPIDPSGFSQPEVESERVSLPDKFAPSRIFSSCHSDYSKSLMLGYSGPTWNVVVAFVSC